MTRKRTASRLLLATGALVLSASAIAGQPLFLGEAKPNAAALRTIDRLAGKRDTFGLRVVRANPAVVARGTREIELDLGGRRVNLVQDAVRTLDNGNTVWSGQIRETAKRASASAREVRNDAANSGILVRSSAGITGNVRMNGKLYRIRPLADGNHAVVEVNDAMMPPEHPAAFDKVPRIAMAGDQAKRATAVGAVGPLAVDPGAPATIRVMVVATNDAIAAYGGDMRALVDLAVAESNQGYVNSNVGINMELANYSTTNYATVDMETDLARFRGTADGFMDNIHATRDANAADVAVLIGNDSAYCGLASGIGSTADTAFATAYWDCATGYYSFAHEIGHLQSARHDPAADPTNNPYAYGHGYRAPNNAWRTIMAYNCSGAGCPRINYWSNPDVTYQGQAMGTADRNDNQRVLVNTKAAMAAFRGAAAPNNPPVANFTFSTNNLTATFTDSSTDNDGNIASRSWTFGDGTSSTATNPSKTYTAAGTYSVKLTVTDDDGASHNVTKSVTVAAAPPTGNALTKGVAKTGLSAATGAYAKFTMVVPAGASNLTFTMSGGTGDADLYVKFGSEPTDSVYDCRPYKDGNAETCTFAAPQAGTYYINLKGYSAFSGVSLVGDYSTGGGGAQTYSNTSDYTINDNATVDSPITVSGRSGNAPSNASVTVAIVHPYQGDLKVDLVAPDGSLYNIHNRTGSSADNVNKTVTLNLSSEPLNGTWKLRVNDNANGDVGKIDSWSVTF